MPTPWRPKRKPIPGERRRDWILPGLTALMVAVLSVTGMVTWLLLLLRWMGWG